MNIFAVAAKKKYRFPYTKGNVTVEDLFDLPVTELDKIYKVLNAKAKVANEDSLLTVKNPADTDIEIQIEIIKYVVKEKQEAVAAKLAEKEKKQRNDRIKEILADREDEALKNMSTEDLKKLLN